MCGSLPASAILHLRQLSLFSMICRLPRDPLHSRALYALTALKPSCKSWFTSIRDVCLQYCLPHPLTLLQKPLPKQTFKKLAKSLVVQYWEEVLRGEATLLPSLEYFDANFHSLVNPHPILYTPGSNPYEVCKALIQCKMKSGRYRTAQLSRHWSPSNPKGYCPAPSCRDTPECLTHLLLLCPFYSLTREKIFRLWTQSRPFLPELTDFLLDIQTATPKVLMCFILDPTSHHQVIHLSQVHGKVVISTVCRITRALCYAIHRERQKLILKIF